MIQACGEPIEIERRDPRVGHHGAIDARGDPGDFGARLVEETRSDQDRIGARAKRNVHATPRLGQRSSVIAGRRMEAPEDGVDDGIVGGVKRLDGEIGKRIDRRPLFEQPTQRLFRVRRLQQRPIGFLAHPSKQNVKTRLQPDRDAMPCDIFARGRVHERAAACRQHHWSAGEQARDHLALALAEISLAEPLEDLGNRQLSARFDLRVGVDERQSKLCREPFSDRGFSGSHHADKNDRAPAKRRRHLSGVDRLALTHKPLNLARKRARPSHTRRRAANARATPPASRPPTVLRGAACSCNHAVTRQQVRSGRQRRRQDARCGR